MDRTDNYNTEYHSASYYQRLVELRHECNKMLTKLQFEQSPEVQEQFKQHLSLLAKEMSPKYQRREDVDKPDVLQDNEGVALTDVSVKQCQELLASFRDLQEKLGITSMARNEYEVSEKGVKKKE